MSAWEALDAPPGQLGELMTGRHNGRRPCHWFIVALVMALPLATALILPACAADDDGAAGSSTSGSAATTASTVPASTTETDVADTPTLPRVVVRTTSGDTTGNRFSPGRGNLVDTVAVDIPLSGTPRWVVGADTELGLTWIVALDDGRLEGWRWENGKPVQAPLNLPSLPAGTPPTVISGPEGALLVEPPAGASHDTCPLPLAGGGLIYVTDDGAVEVQMGDQAHRFEIDALPDARITLSRNGLVAVLAGATTRYPHGALGDEFESGRVTIIDPQASEIVAEAVVPEPSVIEGVVALWADVDGDGQDEILVTVSNQSVGARLEVFDQEGDLVAEGPAIGQGNRWRNQLAVAPFGPDGEIEIVDVRVPHIGGVVEFFRLESGRLTLHAEQGGFTSHMFGSRNLDMALAADADGDGRIEVVVPTQAMDALGLLRRTAEGVMVVAQVELPGTLSTNLAAVVRQDGLVSFAAGTDTGTLRIWPADESG